MLKDKVNNVYINCYKYNDNISKYHRKYRKVAKYIYRMQYDSYANQYLSYFTGQMFINHGDELIIRETTELDSEGITIYDDYNIGYFIDKQKKRFNKEVIDNMMMEIGSRKEEIKEEFKKMGKEKLGRAIEREYNRYRRDRIDMEISEGKFYGRDIFADIQFKTELDYERTSNIEYEMLIDGELIEGVFEVIRVPELKIKEFYSPIIIGSIDDESHMMILNYLLNINYPFIDGKPRINLALSGSENFNEYFQKEKGKEFYKAIDDFKLDNVSWLSCGLALDNVMSFYYRLKSFRNFDILYYDNRVVCVYKRVTKVDSENKELTMNNFSFIFELNSQKSISSYFTDLVVNGEELLSKYDTTQRFYNDINKLIFLLTDTGIIVMPQDREERIFIYSDDLKEYLDKNHYLFYFFNTQELLS